MYSARKLLGICALSILSVGCAQRADDPRTETLSRAPIIEDEAMALRQWELSSSRYANGSSVAYPTLYPYVPRRNVPQVESLITGPALFYGQTLLLPLTAMQTPPWQDTTYRGIYTPPTYTAVPEIPPDSERFRTIDKWPKVERRKK